MDRALIQEFNQVLHPLWWPAGGNRKFILKVTNQSQRAAGTRRRFIYWPRAKFFKYLFIQCFILMIMRVGVTRATQHFTTHPAAVKKHLAERFVGCFYNCYSCRLLVLISYELPHDRQFVSPIRKLFQNPQCAGHTSFDTHANKAAFVFHTTQTLIFHIPYFRWKERDRKWFALFISLKSE